MVFYLRYLIASVFALLSADGLAQEGFVALPSSSDVASAYVTCNTTGRLGLGQSEAPQRGKNDACAISSAELTQSPLNAPLSGFRLVGMAVSDVPMPAPYAGKESAVATLTDAIWRNQDNTECILGTHLQMKDAPMANGQYWNVHDIARAGFANTPVAIAYFYKPHSDHIGGNTEVLFRAGRTFTSVASPLESALPTTRPAPDAKTPIHSGNAAAVSSNWVLFTTDVSFKDDDESARAISSIFYIKYACDARDPVQKPNAIHLRSLGKTTTPIAEIAVTGLVPADADVEHY